MCQISDRQELVRYPMSVWKIVTISGNQYRSEYQPAKRTPLYGWPLNEGRELIYKPYERVNSPSGPGIMAYTDFERVREYYRIVYGWDPHRAVLAMQVPVGTLIRWGYDRLAHSSVVAASCVDVLDVVEGVRRLIS